MKLAVTGPVLAAVGASCFWLAWPGESKVRHPGPGPDSMNIAPGEYRQAAFMDPRLRRNDGGAIATESVRGLALYGLSGGGPAGLAVLGSEEGPQRIVPVGREFLPGLRLDSVGLDHAVVFENGRPYRLELRRYAAAAGPRSGLPLGEVRSSEADQKLAAAALPRELAPVRANGRIAGFAIRRASNLPRLREAGMRDGDVIVSVNGSQFDEERMSELVWELNNAAEADFVLVRNGKKIRLSV